MPELPEVETIRRDLNKQILNKKIKNVKVAKARLVRNPTNFFIRSLIGNSFKAIDRVGKLLVLNLKAGDYLLIHLKMTGQLIYQSGKHKIAGGHSYKSDELNYPNKYTYITITFSDNSSLFFNDMRTFGYMQLVETAELEKIKNNYGVEPTNSKAKLEDWRHVFENKKTNLKSLLLNQKKIAGIGNIYADEICFVSKIRPTRLVSKLTKQEVDLLFKKSKEILNKAIKERGTTFNNFVDSKGDTGNYSKHLKVYGKGGEICKKCKKEKIKKIKLAGRGTHFCPKCQK